MQLIEVSGDHYQMGYQQGEKMKQSILVFGEDAISSPLWQYSRPKNIPPKLIYWLIGVYGRGQLKINMKEIIYHYERIKGIAEGAGISPHWLFAYHQMELMVGDLRSFNLGNCTAIILGKDITKEKSLILGKNYDFPYFLRKHQIVRVSRPKGRYSSICLTQSTLAGNHNGMNEFGLTILYTLCYPTVYAHHGIPITLLIQEALETCKTVEEVIELFKKAKVGNGANLGIADAQNNICVIEICKDALKVRKPEEGFLVHTNHYITEKMQKVDIPSSATYKIPHPLLYGKPAKESSLLRWETATSLIRENKGRLDVTLLQNIFKNHLKETPSENSICRHGELWGTLNSVIFIPEKREIMVAWGQPCQNEYKVYKF